MAATSVAVATVPSSRKTVMENLWNRIFKYFEAEEYSKAETTFKLYTRLDEMSDKEYDAACNCDAEDCYCKQ